MHDLLRQIPDGLQRQLRYHRVVHQGVPPLLDLHVAFCYCFCPHCNYLFLQQLLLLSSTAPASGHVLLILLLPLSIPLLTSPCFSLCLSFQLCVSFYNNSCFSYLQFLLQLTSSPASTATTTAGPPSPHLLQFEMTGELDPSGGGCQVPGLAHCCHQGQVVAGLPPGVGGGGGKPASTNKTRTPSSG